MSRAKRLVDFLKRYEGVPVTWGQDDCTAAPALWLGEERGQSIALRPYRTKEEAYRLIAEAGDLASLWSSALAPLGVRERYAPELGDVGVIEMGRFGQIGIIFGSNRTAFWRRENGGWFGFTPRSYAKVWAVD